MYGKWWTFEKLVFPHLWCHSKHICPLIYPTYTTVYANTDGFTSADFLHSHPRFPMLRPPRIVLMVTASGSTEFIWRFGRSPWLPRRHRRNWRYTTVCNLLGHAGKGIKHTHKYDTHVMHTSHTDAQIPLIARRPSVFIQLLQLMMANWVTVSWWTRTKPPTSHHMLRNPTLQTLQNPSNLSLGRLVSTIYTKPLFYITPTISGCSEFFRDESPRSPTGFSQSGNAWQRINESISSLNQPPQAIHCIPTWVFDYWSYDYNGDISSIN